MNHQIGVRRITEEEKNLSKQREQSKSALMTNPYMADIPYFIPVPWDCSPQGREHFFEGFCSCICPIFFFHMVGQNAERTLQGSYWNAFCTACFLTADFTGPNDTAFTASVDAAQDTARFVFFATHRHRQLKRFQLTEMDECGECPTGFGGVGSDDNVAVATCLKGGCCPCCSEVQLNRMYQEHRLYYESEKSAAMLSLPKSLTIKR